MTGEYQIVYVDEPAWEIVGGGIRDYNIKQAGEDNARTLCFVLSGPGQEVEGGVTGATYWDWLHIDLMWAKPELRGRRLRVSSPSIFEIIRISKAN